MNSILSMGIDLGSTTAKAVVLESSLNPLFSDYRRHNGEVKSTLMEILKNTKDSLGNIKVNLNVTGSSGMGISEKLNIPFIQELIASAEYISKFHPNIKTLIDIGGDPTSSA